MSRADAPGGWLFRPPSSIFCPTAACLKGTPSSICSLRIFVSKVEMPCVASLVVARMRYFPVSAGLPIEQRTAGTRVSSGGAGIEREVSMEEAIECAYERMWTMWRHNHLGTLRCWSRAQVRVTTNVYLRADLALTRTVIGGGDRSGNTRCYLDLIMKTNCQNDSKRLPLLKEENCQLPLICVMIP